jgi:hypothetical protein
VPSRGWLLPFSSKNSVTSRNLLRHSNARLQRRFLPFRLSASSRVAPCRTAGRHCSAQNPPSLPCSELLNFRGFFCTTGPAHAAAPHPGRLLNPFVSQQFPELFHLHRSGQRSNQSGGAGHEHALHYRLHGKHLNSVAFPEVTDRNLVRQTTPARFRQIADRYVETRNAEAKAALETSQL